MARDFITNLLLNEREINALLKEIPEGDASAASDFFVRFGFGPLYHQEKYYETLERGHQILHLVARLDPEKYNGMHKGYAFYWMGMAAYRIHDYQTAIYYIDATLSEDIKNFPGDTNTPPHLFLRLEGDDPKQAAQEIVKGAQGSIEEYATLYNQVLAKNELELPELKIDDIRKWFLRPSTLSKEAPKRSLASTFITFFLEFKYRDFQLSLLRGTGTNEPLFMHLLKGCLLFESLLKNNPSKQIKSHTLGKVLGELTEQLHLNFPGGIEISADTLDEALQMAVTGSDEITSSVTATGKLRNTLSHNLGWPSQISREQYTHGFVQIAVSCLHALNSLYRVSS
jgi:hypothetical protein